MAAVLSHSAALDPNKTAKIPISISPELTRGDGPAEERITSVQWNFKPCLQPSQSAKIKASRHLSGSHVNLVLKSPDEEGEYRYIGSQQPSGSCALIYNSSTKAFVLEKLDVDFTFNLQSTPSNHDRNQVTSQYPQLDVGIFDAESDGGSSADGPAVHGTELSGADASNPYDYRHFLKRRRTSSPEAPISRPSVSPAVAPQRLPRTNIKPKPKPRPQQRPKRPSREEAKADTKADSDDSDDGGLIIEMGDSPRPRRFGNGAVVFNHDRSNGPVSLRSAASSMSPASIRHESGNEEAGSDNDVEHLELPSPETQANGVEDGEGEADDEDDDDLVEGLMQAMESHAEEEEMEGRVDVPVYGQGQPIRRTIEESSSESEEE
ncbi:MAG: hypothetical protein Q9219_007376 [cf. Caloplaca sp. 3 TL-2023]